MTVEYTQWNIFQLILLSINKFCLICRTLWRPLDITFEKEFFLKEETNSINLRHHLYQNDIFSVQEKGGKKMCCVFWKAHEYIKIGKAEKKLEYEYKNSHKLKKLLTFYIYQKNSCQNISCKRKTYRIIISSNWLVHLQVPVCPEIPNLQLN